MEVGRTFALVLDLVERKEVMISDHGYDELAEDAILVKDILASVSKGMVVLDDMRDALCRGDVGKPLNSQTFFSHQLRLTPNGEQRH
jgi:hypothetical protein